MGKVFVFIIVCLSMTLVLSGVIIWGSFDERQEALYQSQILGVKNAEIRDNADVGGAPEVDPDGDAAMSVDYEQMTPGLQQLLREGKPNPEITVDRIR